MQQLWIFSEGKEVQMHHDGSIDVPKKERRKKKGTIGRKKKKVKKEIRPSQN